MLKLAAKNVIIKITNKCVMPVRVGMPAIKKNWLPSCIASTLKN